MTMTDEPATANPVLIIGAGLAGLSLAQGLKRAEPSIPFRILERDTSARFRAQGYRIRISADGAAGLKRLLPDDLWEAFESTCAEVMAAAGGMGGRLDALTGDEACWERPAGPPVKFLQGKQYNADRAVLRNLLLVGLEEHISFGKSLTRYETNQNNDDTVRAFFADGSSVMGSILIGADGIRSPVRSQLLPNFNVLDTEGRAVFGKTFLSPGLTEKLPRQMTSGICLTGPSQNSHVKLLSDPVEFRHPELSTDVKDRLAVPQNYLYWVLCFRRDACQHRSDEDVLRMSPGDGPVQLSHELTTDWHESIRALLDQQHVPSASTLMFHTSTPDSFTREWQSYRQREAANGEDRVILLGDAAHPMPPVGGVGANSAFQEAADLCEALVKSDNHSDSTVGRADALMAYQGKMFDRALAAIQRSATGASFFFGQRPLKELSAVAV